MTPRGRAAAAAAGIGGVAVVPLHAGRGGEDKPRGGAALQVGHGQHGEWRYGARADAGPGTDLGPYPRGSKNSRSWEPAAAPAGAAGCAPAAAAAGCVVAVAVHVL